MAEIQPTGRYALYNTLLEDDLRLQWTKDGYVNAPKFFEAEQRKYDEKISKLCSNDATKTTLISFLTDYVKKMRTIIPAMVRVEKTAFSRFIPKIEIEKTTWSEEELLALSQAYTIASGGEYQTILENVIAHMNELEDLYANENNKSFGGMRADPRKIGAKLSGSTSFMAEVLTNQFIELVAQKITSDGLDSQSAIKTLLNDGKLNGIKIDGMAPAMREQIVELFTAFYDEYINQNKDNNNQDEQTIFTKSSSKHGIRVSIEQLKIARDKLKKIKSEQAQAVAEEINKLIGQLNDMEKERFKNSGSERSDNRFAINKLLQNSDYKYIKHIEKITEPKILRILSRDVQLKDTTNYGELLMAVTPLVVNTLQSAVSVWPGNLNVKPDALTFLGSAQLQMDAQAVENVTDLLGSTVTEMRQADTKGFSVEGNTQAMSKMLKHFQDLCIEEKHKAEGIVLAGSAKIAKTYDNATGYHAGRLGKNVTAQLNQIITAYSKLGIKSETELDKETLAWLIINGFSNMLGQNDIITTFLLNGALLCMFGDILPNNMTGNINKTILRPSFYSFDLVGIIPQSVLLSDAVNEVSQLINTEILDDLDSHGLSNSIYVDTGAKLHEAQNLSREHPARQQRNFAQFYQRQLKDKKGIELRLGAGLLSLLVRFQDVMAKVQSIT